MLRPIRLAAAAAACALLPLSAMAAQPTEQQAQVLQQDLRGWIADVFGPEVKLPEGLLRITPEGDHFRVSVRLGAIPALSIVKGGEVAISAEPLPAGRWLLYHYRFASPLQFRLRLPSEMTGHAKVEMPVEFSIGFDNATWHGILDPSFTSPSIMTAKLEGYEFKSMAGPMRQSGHVDSLTGHALLAPSGNGRIDVTDQSAADDFTITTKGATPEQSVAVFMGHLEAIGKLAGVDPARVRSLFQVSTQAAQRAEQHPPSPKEAMAELRDAYLKLRGIATGGELVETLTDLRGCRGRSHGRYRPRHRGRRRRHAARDPRRAHDLFRRPAHRSGHPARGPGLRPEPRSHSADALRHPSRRPRRAGHGGDRAGRGAEHAAAADRAKR